MESETSQVYPVYAAHGTHRELGLQHGEQARKQIRGFLDYLGETLHLSREQVQSRALTFLPLFQQHVPHLVEEIHGLAEGAGVSFAEALAVQVRGELGQVSDGACTTFVVSGRGTADGQILIGQNSDVEPELEEFAYVLRLRPMDGPALLMWTFGGMIGYHGVNAAGVAHFANSLGGGPAWKLGLPHYPVKRLMLEQRTLPDVLSVLRRVPICSSGNYVLCDGEGRIADVELTPDGFALSEDDGAGYLVHSNHFLCGPYACPATDTASVPDSFPRLDRIRELVSGQRGSLTVARMREILSDHAGHPTSICRHPSFVSYQAFVTQ